MLLPSVSIFWGVQRNGRTVLVMERTTLAEAEAYGNCFTYARGHYEVWEAWRRLGPPALHCGGLPPAIAVHECEKFPRGPVVYMRGPALFTVYAGRRLQRPETIAELVQLFGCRLASQ